MNPVTDTTIIINGQTYTLVPQTNDEPTDNIKTQIAKRYTDKTINTQNLQKVVSNEMKNVAKLGERRVLTLDDERKVIFNYAGQFYVVKKSDKTIQRVSMQDKGTDVINGTIFNDYDVYVDTNVSDRNVFEPTIISGGSRKNYRKSSKRVRYSKKSSRSRSYKYRKHK
jgi:hypothetical protein